MCPNINCIVTFENPLIINFRVKSSKVNIVYYIVYKTTNLLKKDGEENRFYVGMHKQLNNIEMFDDYYGSGILIKESISKYGEINHKREILEICKSLKESGERETYWIEKLHANKLKYPNDGGMNLNDGGIGCKKGVKRSEECKNKLRKSKSEEHCRKISESKKGKHLSEEHKHIISINSRSGEREVREKISKGVWGEKNPRNNYIYTILSGENYWEYFTVKERNCISCMFRYANTNTILYHGVSINRKLKDHNLSYVKTKYIYTIISPDKIEFKDILCLRNFCKEHNLNYSGVTDAIRNNRTYKNGWIFYRTLKVN